MAEENKTSLEEKAKEFATLTMPFTDETYVDEGAYHGFIAGYEQAKKDMMKEAVEGTLGYGPHLQRPIIMLEQVPDIWNGSCQSVKIIIVRE